MAYKFMKNHLQVFPEDVSNIICRYIGPNPRWVKFWKDDSIREIKYIISDRIFRFKRTRTEVNFINSVKIILNEYIQYRKFDTLQRRILIAYKDYILYDIEYPENYEKPTSYSVNKIKYIEETYKMRSYAIIHGYIDSAL
jgi:hypothetical protein